MVVPPTMPPDNPKTALRRIFRALRRDHVAALGPTARDAAQAALAEMIGPALGDSQQAASYAAVGAEIDPIFIEAGLVSTAFPRVSGRDLIFHTARRADLQTANFGIPEPAQSAAIIVPALLLVPVVAVTRTGVRLGQGGGFYDRTLAALRAQAPTIAIGLAWDVQLADALPADPWDAALDWIATPTRLVNCAAQR